jgi:hypothetical protein
LGLPPNLYTRKVGLIQRRNYSSKTPNSNNEQDLSLDFPIAESQLIKEDFTDFPSDETLHN